MNLKNIINTVKVTIILFVVTLQYYLITKYLKKILDKQHRNRKIFKIEKIDGP